MQAVIALILASGASAFLKNTFKAEKVETKLTSWEQMQEDALERAGSGLPKTVIRVASAPVTSSLLELQGSEHAAQEVIVKAPECLQCVEEHFEDLAAKIAELGQESYAEACSFCALYAFGGIYAGQDAQVHPKAWSSLPKDKISVVKGESLLASPPRKTFWKDAVKKVVEGTWSLPSAITDASSQLNVLECDKAMVGEKCTVYDKPSTGGPMVLLEVHSKATLTQKYNRVHSGIKNLMSASNSMLADAEDDLKAAEKSGDKVMKSVAKEALESMKTMTEDAVQEDDNLKKQIDTKEAASPASLLQTQRIEMEVDAEKSMIKDAVRDAVDHLKNSGEQEYDGQDMEAARGEALLEATYKLLEPIADATQKDKTNLNFVGKVWQLSRMDPLVRDMVGAVELADIVSSGAKEGKNPVQALEESAAKLYKQYLTSESDDNINGQTNYIVKQLAKFLPKEQQEQPKVAAKKVLLKAKDSAEPVLRQGEEADKEAMDALQGALEFTNPSIDDLLSHPSVAFMQKEASEYAAEMDKAMSALAQEKAKAEEDYERLSLEADLGALGGQDKSGEAWEEPDDEEPEE